MAAKFKSSSIMNLDADFFLSLRILKNGILAFNNVSNKSKTECSKASKTISDIIEKTLKKKTRMSEFNDNDTDNYDDDTQESYDEYGEEDGDGEEDGEDDGDGGGDGNGDIKENQRNNNIVYKNDDNKDSKKCKESRKCKDEDKVWNKCKANPGDEFNNGYPCGIPVNNTQVYSCVEQTKTYMYQTQKKIWNTVRVPSSLYQNDLTAVSVFQRPILKTRVNWNQMSDRALPHGQHGNPASYGVDVKHNSYYRYYNRLKGKGPARAQPWPKEFGKQNLPFNYAYPVYGNKLFKTNILGMKCLCKKYIK